MTASRNSILVVNDALDETPQGEVILRGVISPDSLDLIQVDAYQREILSNKKVLKLMKAIRETGVPDIELGMRGQRYRQTDAGIYLQDPVFVIDGLQRREGALRWLRSPESEFIPHLGVKVHFDTNEEIEREMFEALNLGQTSLSSNITLRNQAAKLQVVENLIRLSKKSGFVLQGRISWNQQMKKGQLITAMTFARIVGMLHSHAGPGRASEVLVIANGLQKIMDNVGPRIMIQNVEKFFDVVDQCWGVNRVYFRQSAPHLRANFLTTLARIFSDHTNFWKEDTFYIEPSLLKKLAGLPIDDPEIIRLASASGAASEILYQIIVKDLNAGKRTRRLQQRRSLTDAASCEGTEEEDEEEDGSN